MFDLSSAVQNMWFFIHLHSFSLLYCQLYTLLNLVLIHAESFA